MSLTAQGDQLPVVVRHHLEVMCGSGGRQGNGVRFKSLVLFGVMSLARLWLGGSMR